MHGGSQGLSLHQRWETILDLLRDPPAKEHPVARCTFRTFCKHLPCWKKNSTGTSIHLKPFLTKAGVFDVSLTHSPTDSWLPILVENMCRGVINKNLVKGLARSHYETWRASGSLGDQFPQIFSYEKAKILQASSLTLVKGRTQSQSYNLNDWFLVQAPSE